MVKLGGTLTQIDRMEAAYIAAKRRGFSHPMLHAVKELRSCFLELDARAADQAANGILLSISQHEEKYGFDLP